MLRRACGLCAVLLLLAAACAGGPRKPPHRELDALWNDYSKLPGQRALAIAGQIRKDRWVAGATGGHASRDDAAAMALSECKRHRAKQRMQAPCQLYAIGNDVVWTGP